MLRCKISLDRIKSLKIKFIKAPPNNFFNYIRPAARLHKHLAFWHLRKCVVKGPRGRLSQKASVTHSTQPAWTMGLTSGMFGESVTESWCHCGSPSWISGLKKVFNICWLRETPPKPTITPEPELTGPAPTLARHAYTAINVHLGLFHHKKGKDTTRLLHNRPTRGSTVILKLCDASTVSVMPLDQKTRFIPKPVFPISHRYRSCIFSQSKNIFMTAKNTRIRSFFPPLFLH